MDGHHECSGQGRRDGCPPMGMGVDQTSAMPIVLVCIAAFDLVLGDIRLTALRNTTGASYGRFV